MTFRDALLTACCQDSAISTSQGFGFADANVGPVGNAHDDLIVTRLREMSARRQRFWKMLEYVVAHIYERETGKKLPANVDWAKLLQWLKDHLPMILSIIGTLVLIL